jgi:hypothetical protein
MRHLETLLEIETDEAANAGDGSALAFLRGAPTRTLSAEWFWTVYHGLVAVVLLGALSVFLIRDAMENATVSNILTGVVALLALAVWMHRRNTARRRQRLCETLTRVLLRHDLTCAAAIDSAWKVVGTAGEFDRLDNPHLAEALLGPHGEAMRTYRALGVEPLPQIVTAGGTMAIADKPSKALAVIVFGRATTRDVAARARAVSESIRTEFRR